VSRLQLKALFLSRTPLRILRTGSGIDPGTAFERPLAGAVKCVCRSRPRKATRPSYITIASHLSPASPATYLNGQHRPPYRPRLPCVFSCLASLLFSSCRVPPCRCYCYCRPAVQFNDTQDHRPSHPHLRPLRLCRPQLRERTIHPRYQIVLTTASLAGSDNALPIQSTYLIPTLALSTALRLVSLSGARLQPSPRAVQPVSSLLPSGVGGAWTVLIYSLSTLRITSAAHIRAAYRSYGHCDGCPAAGT